MKTLLPRPRVGLLALTLELYESLAQGLRAGRERWLRDAVLPALSSIADVDFRQAVYRREDIDASVRQFEHDGVDALLVICLTYSPSQLALPALQRTRLPILVWNTQELHAVDDSFDGSKMTENHGVHGTQDLCSVLLRSGVRFEYVTSHLSDADPLGGLENIFLAAAATARLRRLRLGLMGYPFPGMGDLGLDTTHLVATLGCHWQMLAIEQFNQRAADAGRREVAALVDVYRESYELAGDLAPADLEATARGELALRAMVDQYQLGALSYQFMALGEDERTETLPFVAISRLMAEGVGFGGEGDLIGATGTWLLGQLQPPVTFSEIFTTDFAGNGLFMSHMGECNPAMARTDRKIPLVARPAPIARIRGRQLALVVSLEPGPATLSALALGPGGRWRLVASRVEIDDFGPLGAMAVPHFRVKVVGTDVRQWLTAYATAGGPHHNALCFGDATGRLQLLARFLDADYCEV
ncbi:MAG: L-arabinose isomerase family protein [Thermoguttaceae bacterium]